MQTKEITFEAWLKEAGLSDNSVSRRIFEVVKEEREGKAKSAARLEKIESVISGGGTYRDAAKAVGISHQRVYQIMVESLPHLIGRKRAGHVTFNCETCGKEVKRLKSQMGEGSRNYCSLKCKGLGSRKQYL